MSMSDMKFPIEEIQMSIQQQSVSNKESMDFRESQVKIIIILDRSHTKFTFKKFKLLL